MEGRDAGAGETAPEKEQAPTASPEAAREGDSAEKQEPKQWTPEERAAAIEAERARQEQEQGRTPQRGGRGRGDDDDGGRGRERTR